MDKSDLQTMLQFASQNGMMKKPFTYVHKWYQIANSLEKSDYPSYNVTLWSKELD
jgi:hypothetical protein